MYGIGQVHRPEEALIELQIKYDRLEQEHRELTNKYINPPFRIPFGTIGFTAMSILFTKKAFPKMSIWRGLAVGLAGGIVGYIIDYVIEN